MLARARLCRVAVTALVAMWLLAQMCGADRIAYQGRLVMGSRGIVVMSGNGDNPVELPHPSASDRITPALSPDGTMLAYAAMADDAYKIWIVRLGDNNSPAAAPVQVTTGDPDDEQPAWSPDGRRIAYVSGKAEERGLYTISVEGGSPSFVTALGSDFRSACPHWSPDGSRLVFTRDEKLFIVGADGGSARELTDDGMYPSWSPDGSQIAFFRQKQESALSLISPGGGAPRTLVNNVGFFGETAWSPDGKSIAFKADEVDGVEGSLWVVTAAGGEAKPLRSYGVPHGYLDWSASPVQVAAAPTPEEVVVSDASPRPSGEQASGTAATTPKPAPMRLAMATEESSKQPPKPASVKPSPQVTASVKASPKPAASVTPTSPPPEPVQSASASEEPAKPVEALAQQPPVRILSPADNATVRGLTKVTVSKDSPGGYVGFFVDGTFAKATVAPFEMEWDTRPSGDGPHTIQVTAYGEAGRIEGTAEARVEVRNAISADTLPEEGVALRYRYKEKEKWDYGIRVTAQAGAKGEVPMAAVAAQAGTLDALITQRVESVGEAPQQESGRPGTPGAAPPGAAGPPAGGEPAEMETIATIITQVRTGRLDAPGTGGRLPQVGQAGRSRQNLEGELTPLAGGGSQPIALGNLSIVFPEEPIKIGDKWTAPMTVLPLLRSNAVARVTAEHTAEALQWEQGLETIRIVSTFKVGSLPVGLAGMSMLNVTGTRTTWFAYKEHQVLRIEDTVQGVFNQKAALAAAQTAAAPATRTTGAGQVGRRTAGPGTARTARPSGGLALRLGGGRDRQPAGTRPSPATRPRGAVGPGALQLRLGGARGGRQAPRTTTRRQPAATARTSQGAVAAATAAQPAAKPPTPTLRYTLTLAAARQK